MSPDEKAKFRWTLYAPNEDGKERVAGKFVSDSEAFQFVDRYKVDVWRLKGPDVEVRSTD